MNTDFLVLAIGNVNDITIRFRFLIILSWRFSVHSDAYCHFITYKWDELNVIKCFQTHFKSLKLHFFMYVYNTILVSLVRKWNFSESEKYISSDQGNNWYVLLCIWIKSYVKLNVIEISPFISLIVYLSPVKGSNKQTNHLKKIKVPFASLK